MSGEHDEEIEDIEELALEMERKDRASASMKQLSFEKLSSTSAEDSASEGGEEGRLFRNRGNRHLKPMKAMTESELDARKRSRCSELMVQLSLFMNIAVPSMLINVGVQSLWLFSSSFAGTRLGPHALGGFVLASLCGNLLGKSILLGMLSAFDTLAGNAMGAGNFEEVGLLVQRSVLLNGILCVPIIIFWFNIEPLLVLLGQPVEVNGYVSQFLRVYSFIFPADMLTEQIKSFYRCQNICIPFVYITGVALSIHYVALSYFVPWAGFTGISYAHLCSQFSYLAFCLLYAAVFRQHDEETWKGVNLSKALTLGKLVSFLKLGLPGILSMSEWWFWEGQTLLVGTLGAAQLAAHSVAYNIIPLAFHLPFGVGLACQTRVATLLADGNHELAKKVAMTSLLMGFFIGATTCSTLYLFQEYVFSFFVEPEATEVLENLRNIWPVVAIFLNFDAQLAVSEGLFRGIGLHGRLSLIIVFGLWVVGVPIELYMGFESGLGLLGFWIGLIIVYLLLDLGLVSTICCIDWSQQIQVSEEENVDPVTVQRRNKEDKIYHEIGSATLA